MRKALISVLAAEIFLVCTLRAQAPTGAIAGVVTDPDGGVVPAAHVVITNKDTGLKRTFVTAEAGEYSAPALPAGVYEVTAEAPGFERVKRDTIIEAGNTTTVNLAMPLGTNTQTVTVAAASPQIRYDAFEVSGVVTHSEVEGLPLNGRSFLELSKLEPGAQQPKRQTNDRTMVPLSGSPTTTGGGRTRVTVDGGSIMEIGTGGAAMGFSQEVVQEFQVSTVNFDLSTGTTAEGAVNVVTRSGGNELHGSAFDFFRDDKLSAYPELARDPSNPTQFFQRQQFGLALGGPIRRDRAFFFGTYERNDQRGVVSTMSHSPEFAPLSRLTPSPTFVNQFSMRADFLVTDRHSAFLRHSHEGVSSYAPSLLFAGGRFAYPSAWRRQPAWADQSILGLMSQLRSNLVNDLRFSYFFVSSEEQAPRQADCPGCLGIGAPAITINPPKSGSPAELAIGTSLTTTVLGRRYHLNDIVAWQKGPHRIRFGGDLEVARGGETDLANEPVAVTLYSPEQVRSFNARFPAFPIPLPASFLTLQGILQLPVHDFSVGIGDPHVPQTGFGKVRVAPLIHTFYQDAWRLRPPLTVNYGLGWTYEAPLNYDLSKPGYLAPILGEGGLGPTHKDWKNFSPSAGFAWSPRKDSKTVIRGGMGIYYDFQTSYPIADKERVSLGPRGVGRSTYGSAGISNPISVPGLPAGRLLNVLMVHPTLFTGEVLMQALAAIRTNLAEQRGDSNNRDFSLTNIEADKQGLVVNGTLPSTSATHVSLGVQREIASNFVVNADFVFRQFTHLGFGIDLNHFASARGPVIPICSPAQRNDPKAQCSLGPISAFMGFGNAHYQGLLVRADKRFSHRWQFLGSYAYSSVVGTNFGNGFNNDDWLANYGPLDIDFRHILNLSGLVELPKMLQLGFVVTYNSRAPFSAFLGGLDLNGDGTTGDLLPGTTVNQFNRGLGKADLVRLVNAFNNNQAGKVDALGRLIPAITLPTNFDFGSRFLTHDLRLSREFAFRDRWRMTLVGEVFNLFNVSNLSGYSGDLLSPGFGQPTSRVTQVFGSGGPRSFQLAARLSF